MRYVLALALLISLTACSKQVRPEVVAYFSALCEKEGFAKGTEENAGCVRVKAAQAQPVQVRGPNRTSTTCATIGGNVHCN